MKPIVRIAVLPLILIAFGCKGNDAKSTDAALNSDLSLASQAHPMTPADSISAIEKAHSDSVAARRSAAQVAGTRSTVHHSYSSGAAAQPAPVYSTQRNTKRDAAIGAGAGAILGAVTSKNKVKGGIIGGILGGVAGGVLGNNVDTKKVRHP